MFFGQEIEDSRKQFKAEVLCSMIYLDISVQIMIESSCKAIVQSITVISIIKSLDFYKRENSQSYLLQKVNWDQENLRKKSPWLNGRPLEWEDLSSSPSFMTYSPCDTRQATQFYVFGFSTVKWWYLYQATCIKQRPGRKQMTSSMSN